MRLAAQAKGGFYPTPPRVVDLVAQLLYGARGRARSADTLRILDPCCGAGDALAQFADLLRDRSTVPVETCGVELHRDRAEQAAHVLDRALACDLFATSIANNAFGVLLLNPPYDWDKEDKRVEHAFLTHTTRYLTDGGLLLFIVPKQSASPSPPATSPPTTGTSGAGPSPTRSGRSSTRWCWWAGARAEPSPDPYAEEQVRDWAEGEPEEFSPRPYPVYDPPVVAAGEILFATRTVDPLAAVAEARKTGLWASQEVQGLPLARRRPAHPPVDAAPPGPHGHAGGGGFPRQPGAGGRRPGASWSRAARPRRWCWPRRRRTRRSTGNGSGPPWWPWTWTTGRSPTSPPDPAQRQLL